MDFSEALQYIVNEFGAEILKNGTRTCALLSDLAPHLSKERRLLQNAYYLAQEAMESYIDGLTGKTDGAKSAYLLRRRLEDGFLADTAIAFLMNELCAACKRPLQSENGVFAEPIDRELYQRLVNVLQAEWELRRWQESSKEGEPFSGAAKIPDEETLQQIVKGEVFDLFGTRLYSACSLSETEWAELLRKIPEKPDRREVICLVSGSADMDGHSLMPKGYGRGTWAVSFDAAVTDEAVMGRFSAVGGSRREVHEFRLLFREVGALSVATAGLLSKKYMLVQKLVNGGQRTKTLAQDGLYRIFWETWLLVFYERARALVYGRRRKG